MKRIMLTMWMMLFPALLGFGETVLSIASSSSVQANTTFVDGSSLSSSMKIDYDAFDGAKVGVVTLNGAKMLASNQRGSYTWQPQKTGANTLVWSSANVAMTSKVNVVSLPFAVAPSPNPPMAKVSTIGITPTTRDVAQTGAGAAIITSGSGNWTAAVSDSWITLNSTSGAAGYPVAYTVSANPDVEDRVGYVYVAGYTHTITQKGLGCTVNKTNVEVERDGGKGTVTITPTDTRSGWKARPNCDWISVSPTSGTGSGTVTYQVAPWYEVSTRSGTITVGGKTITIFQYGSRIELDSYSTSCDYYTHVIPITVNALAITSWTVKPNASWISVVDGGNGKGGDLVSIAVGENPSYKARTGTVTIGTETFTVTQAGRTALAFSVSPATTTADVSGANGLASVTATPDLPWTVSCNANWITVLPNFKSGAGNGNVVYTVSPQNTLYSRTGTITVTPEAASKMTAKTHKVTQPAATSAVSLSGYEFAASGESVAIEVTVNNIVEWKVVESIDWLTVQGATSRVGPGTVTLVAAANDSVYPRSGTLKIAEKTVKVSQKARGVEVEYDNKLFGTDGGMESISIHPDGKVAWTAVASDPTWIVIYQNDSGTGDAEIMYIIAPYTGDGSPRVGWIDVGDKRVYITQRAYDLDISPRGDWVTGNAGAGEIAVSAGIKDVWSAIVTEPWITIVTGYDAGTGNGTVRFAYTDNETGKTRVGKIIVAGEAYTLTQAARIMVPITTAVEGGGRVTGGGSYALGSKVSLEAVANDGYEFLYWSGDAGETMQNPIEVTADVAKSVVAHFGPLTPEFTKTEVSTEGVKLTWRGLAWATQYKIYRAPTDVFPAAAIVTLEASKGTSWQDTTGDVGKTYFYWVEAIGVDDTTECKEATSGAKQKPIVYSSITYTNLKGATHANPSTYQEGTLVSLSAPSAVTGYTFTGWTPSAITATMKGAQAVMANWKANTYTIAYNANGGSGTMAGTAATYDQDATLAACAFTRTGFEFVGWATDVADSVAYAAGATVRNLSALQGGVVTLYAVWSINRHTITVGSTWGEGGSATYDYGSTVSLYAPEAVVDAGAKTKYVCLGSSDYPESGTNVTLTVTGDVSFAWDMWQTNYWVSSSVEGPGTVDFTDGWRTNGSEVVLTAIPSAGAKFVGWTIDSASDKIAEDALAVSVLKPLSIIATFAQLENYAITYTDLKGATHANPAMYQEGAAVTFTAPSAVTGYTFTGWTPGSITEETRGDLTVTAAWTANAYRIVYDANGGEGETAATDCTYDAEAEIGANAFTRVGYTFAGWATSADGEVIYAPGTAVSNLTAVANGVVTLYAVWEALPPPPTDTEDPLTGGTGEAKIGGVETDNVAGWTVVERGDAKAGTSCLRGTMTEVYDEVSNSTFYSAKVKGEGTLSFWWKTSCEADPAGEYTWDHAEFWVDDQLVSLMDGESDWQEVSVAITGDGDHVIMWMYVTDGYAPEVEGLEECVLIDGLSWTGEAYALEPLANPVISPADGSTFATETCTVTIDCETSDAEIYYSTNGRTPSMTEANRYKGPFEITKTTTVKAVAVRGGEKSVYVTAVITKENPPKHYTIAYNANGGEGTMTATTCTEDVAVTLPECTFTRKGYSFVGWALDGAAQPESAPYHAGDVVTNLATDDGTTVTLYAVWNYLPLVNPVITPADGATFSAESCEVTISCDSADATIYYSTNGRTPSTTETARYKGSFEITKTTTVKAVAVRGNEKSEYVSATITKVEPKLEDVTVGKDVTGRDEPVTVPASWVTETLVARYGAGKAESFKSQFGMDLAAALAKPTGKVDANGKVLTVWDDYVAGTDPTDPTSVFRTIIEIVGGKVRISWEPNLNDGSMERSYKLWGRISLDADEWHRPANGSDNFFRVEVDLPTGEGSDAPSVFAPGKEDGLGGVQLWEGGPYWATCNVGAEKPEEYGYYFWWGDTVGYMRDGGTLDEGGAYYSDVTWVSSTGERMVSSPFVECCPTCGKRDSELQAAGYIDSTRNLASAYDAATQHWGAPWRMPTAAEFNALISNCTTTWMTSNGVYGLLVTGKGAYSAKNIFLPAAGAGRDSHLLIPGLDIYYWSSTPNSDQSDFAYELDNDSIFFYCVTCIDRCQGQSVRPVRGSAK